MPNSIWIKLWVEIQNTTKGIKVTLNSPSVISNGNYFIFHKFGNFLTTMHVLFYPAAQKTYRF